LATLVLSTVGQALGGPVGGAIGALIGQSIDQGLLGGSRGPRLGDLSVQTSSYGTQVPRIYGTMRVAGSIVWATDLVEGSSAGGVKGQPDAPNYSVSLAVALSSRPINAIGRIWADGKLIRDPEGTFSVGTAFRLQVGSEDQGLDPFIGSTEGISNTPAYRGLALAVFENLELGEFGNRIPFLTFEVIADEGSAFVGAVLNDAARGAIDCTAAEQVDGYAAYGRSIRSAVGPLVDCFAIELVDDGLALRSPAGAGMAIPESDFGNSADAEAQPRTEREQLPASELPAALRLSYYDEARDFQAGEARASAGEQQGSEEQVDLPAVLGAGAAKSLAQRSLARRWTQRDKLTLRLPPKYLGLQPGSVVALPLAPVNWIVEQCRVDGFVVVAELRPSWKPAISLNAEPGRIPPNVAPGVADVSLTLFDLPQLFDQSSTQPTLILAASSPSPGWKSSGAEIVAGAQTSMTRTALRKSALGRTLGVLAAGEPYLVDDISSVEVELIDADQWLMSCDDDALVNGSNLAAIGGELIQFGEAVPVGPARFRLSRLLRGRTGTEWAAGGHSIGEAFVLIEADAVRPLELPDWAVGSQISARIPGGATEAATITATAESLRPPSPVNLAASFNGDGDLALSWVRRSRRGWAWLDEIDAPLGESREQYRVTLNGPLGSIDLTCATPGLTIIAGDLASLGSGTASIDVRQIGDFAASHPAQATINIA